MNKDYIILIGPSIAGLLAVIGWFVTNNQNNRREDRKELKFAIDAIIIEIKNLQEKILTYYVSDWDEKSIFLERQIKRDCELLDNHVHRLAKMRTKNFKEVQKLVKYSKILTERPFEQKERAAIKPLESILLSEISLAANELINELEEKYNSEVYPTKG